MKLLIITHTPHILEAGSWFAYGPYVREMRLWEKQAGKISVVAPVLHSPVPSIFMDYKHPELEVMPVPSISLLGIQATIKTVLQLPKILWTLYATMRQADHIHLRCPGNIGLLGCLVQVFFPATPKTAKYAGNWDPKAKQPWSYRLQRWLLKHPGLTKNMQVLVYGQWENRTKNIRPFFTASYSKEKCEIVSKNFLPPFRFLFVGGLVSGKKPRYALEIFHRLLLQNIPATMEVYGDGNQKYELQAYIQKYKLEKYITLFGNQPEKAVVQAYKKAHFLMLPSKSEGWPKAVAEAMFFGCIPITTPVSCVPEMVGQGTRGFLLCNDLEKDTQMLERAIRYPKKLEKQSLAAQRWAQQYTLEAFEEALRKILAHG